MKERLLELGLRKEGKFILHSGKESPVFWDIEALFRYSKWVRLEAIKNFTWKIGLANPEMLVGIRRGGYLLAKDVGGALSLKVLDNTYHCHSKHTTSGCPKIVLIDDVLTTGGTVREYLKKTDNVVSIAVLINRSGISEIEDIPVISGLVIDEVR